MNVLINQMKHTFWESKSHEAVDIDDRLDVGQMVQDLQ